MAGCLVDVVDTSALGPASAGTGEGTLALLRRRRSIRRLRPGPLSDAALERILDAICLTPAAYNRPPWHLVLIQNERTAFWDVVEGAFRDRLAGDRLERYLARVAGFREAALVVLVYEDRTLRAELADAWNISLDLARAFAEQGIGMVQLALWLALTAEGLVASLQHWEEWVEDRYAAFLNLPADRYRLIATVPIGYPDELPRPTDRPALADVVSIDRFRGER